MYFRSTPVVDKPRAEKASGVPQGALLGKDAEVRRCAEDAEELMETSTDVGDDSTAEDCRIMDHTVEDHTVEDRRRSTVDETSLRRPPCTDYSADWKDTRRYPGDGAAAPQHHRKLCT